MPKYDIKRGAAIIASVIAEGSQNVEAMGVNEVTMKFTLITPVVFQVGDWCTVYENKYVVYRKPEYTKKSEREHEYDLYLVHEFYKLQDSLLMGVDKNAQLNEKQFFLTGNLQAFADLVLLNANRNDSGWTLGTVDTTDAKTLQFDGENILASLNRIASEFETEFWIEGKTISFAKRLTNSGITLSYGENKGLISLTKGNKDANATIFTRLFVEGAERNLPSYTNYGFKRLQLPSANNGKVDNTSAIASFGVIEHYAKFDDIYPKHTGTITSVGDEFTFYDTNLPFDVNAQLLPGVTAYVAFQSGVLAGYNFDIASFDNATKKIIINENEDEKTVTLPNATLKPAVGDKYIVFDIQMPQTHIDTASNELLAKANELLAQGSDIDFNDAFSGNCDPLYFKRNSITPVLGQYARLFETNPAIDVTKRMSRISRDLQNEWKYDITFTDKIEVNTVVREYIKTIEETNVINETKDRTIINRDAVRRAAQRIDILRDDVFDPDGYFDGTHLKPETIEAIMGTFGYKSGNLTLEGVAFSLNVGGVANNFNITAGKLIHFAYDIGGDYTWVMGSMTSSFADSAQGYYIYAKISKITLTGSWVVNNSKLQVDNEVGYYTLLIGRVYPVTNGKREVDLLYGVTNIVGNRIQTGIIQDLAGTNFWNLDTGEMRVSGQITVGAGSNVYTKDEVDEVAGNTNYLSQPSNYKAGDTWTLQADLMLNGIQYKAGDMLTASAASASYNQAHWTKQVRYTDIEGIKIGGRNLYINAKTLILESDSGENKYRDLYVSNYAKSVKKGTFTVSYDLEYTGAIAGAKVSLGIYMYYDGLSPEGFSFNYVASESINKKRVVNSFVLARDAYPVSINSGVEINAGASKFGTVKVSNVKLEIGNVATAYSDSPEESPNGAGGRNYWINTTANILYQWGLTGTNPVKTERGFSTTFDTALRLRLYIFKQKKGSNIFFFKFKTTKAGIYLLDRESGSPTAYDVPANTWVTLYRVNEIPHDIDDQFIDVYSNGITTGGTIWVEDIMAMQGNYTSGYVFPLETIQAKIDHATDDLETYVDGSFKDGVIDTAEAKAIEKYINVVNETYEQLAQQYSVLYGDPLLTGTPKTNLATAKTNLDGAKSNLINSINTAIADGKTTIAEKADVDSKYAAFKTKIGEYTTATENAYKSITDAINGTANSKAKLFTTNPPTNYNAGDLWLPQSNYTDSGTTFVKDDLYRATTTNAAFNKAHWVKATKYTDDTAANSKNTTFTGATAPTAKATNDVWFDTSEKKWKIWNGSSWIVREDSVVGFLKQALEDSTEIDGGLTLTTAIGARSGGVVKAYMSAASESPYAFAAGVTDFGLGSEARAFGVKHNGDIEVTYGGADRLRFVAATGVLTISGTVNATAGSIGGFTIESNKLKSATPAWETEALVLNKTANTFEFYSGYQTDDGTQYGNIIPDIKIQAVQGFKDILNNPVGEIYCGGFYALPTRYSTVVGGNGISSNCSNISFKPDKSESGKESNASIAARIKVDADKIGDSIYGFYSRRISAAIAGVTDLTQGSNDSRTYGGYFNSLFTGTFHTGVKEISSSSTFYLAGEFITTIYCASGASGAWLMFPSINHEEGRVLIIRNSSGGSVNISRTSSENLYLGDNSSVTTTSIGNKRTQIWQRLGNAWRLLIDQAF